jgi:hypothetical protein
MSMISLSSAPAFFRSLFATRPRTKPEKMWCFYLDPYRKGLNATGVAFGLALVATLIVFLVIAVITLGLFLTSIILYVGSVVASLWAVAETNSRSDNNGATLIVGCIMFYICTLIFPYGAMVWTAGQGFWNNVTYISDAWSFIRSHLVHILVFIVLPFATVLLVAGLTIALNYSARWFETIFSRINGIRYPCPECSQPTEPANYLCPNCNSAHPVPLRPSQYGIFRHHCAACSTSMPTMMLLKRNNLPHKCPHCSTDLTPGALGVDKHIAFVGGTGSGKTCLLQQFMGYLIKKGGNLPEADQFREFENLQLNMERGETPPKTQVKNTYRAFQVLHGKGRIPWNLHFYDIAGEKFEHSQDAAAHRFYVTLDSVVFVFDPFCIQEFREEYSKNLPSGFLHSNQDPLELIRNLTQVLERYRNREGVKKITLNVLMVKTDTGYLDEYLNSAVNQQQIETVIKNFLVQELHQGAFVHHIEHSFTKINYLYASALGRTPDGMNRTPFVPQNVDQTFDTICKGVGVRI